MNATCSIFIRTCAISLLSLFFLLSIIILFPCFTSASSVSSLYLITHISRSTNAYHCFCRRIAMDGRTMAEVISSIADFRIASWLHLPFTNGVVPMATSLRKGNGRSDSRFSGAKENHRWISASRSNFRSAIFLCV